jgi:urease accessory protein
MTHEAKPVMTYAIGRRGDGWRLFVTAGLAALLSSRAHAHVGTGLPGGFVSGFIHPLSGTDHLLAMVSVGIWGAFLGRPLIYVLPVVFPVMMVGGAILGMFVIRMPPVEVGIAISVLVLGGCIALAVRPPVWAATLIVAVFAVFHGYAHGQELPSAADPVSYSSGFVLATGLLHVSGIVVGKFNTKPNAIITIRCIGGVIGVLGGWFLYRAVGV